VGDPSREREGELLPGGERLGRLLGLGGMAAVYAATSREGEAIAVKIMRRELLEAPTVRERFLREGRVTSALKHPGIPKIHAMHELPDGTIAISMELLRGETVAGRMDRRGGYLAQQEVIAIADRVLSVLEVAHASDVIHRDIKPDNVFLTAEGDVKLLDFGVARAREAKAEALTIAGHAIGTPAFMAPEQASGRWHEVDVRTDLWAVGATMYAALAGDPPHARDDIHEELIAAAREEAKPIGDVVAGLKKPLCAVIDRALRKKRDERFPDATAMRSALLSAWEETFGQSSLALVWDGIASDIVTAGEAGTAQARSAAATQSDPPRPAPVPAASSRSEPTVEPRRDPESSERSLGREAPIAFDVAAEGRRSVPEERAASRGARAAPPARSRITDRIAWVVIVVSVIVIAMSLGSIALR
jgi:serine/threonine protein kinase